MAEWRTWKESDEHQPTRKRNKSESAHVTEHSEPTEHDKKLKAPSNVPRHSRLREAQTGHDTMELEVRPSIRQMLTGLETLIRNQADSGIKRRRPPAEDNQQPPKRTTRQEKAYSHSHSYKSLPNYASKQGGPILPQKHKAQPTQPPWRTPPTVAHTTRRRQSPISEGARPRHKTTGQEIVLSSPTSPNDEERPGQLPPLAEIDGRTINHDYPPFAATPTWDPAQSQTGVDGRRRRAIWR